MGDFNPPHPVRKVAIPDHLWDAFEEMASADGERARRAHQPGPVHVRPAERVPGCVRRPGPPTGAQPAPTPGSPRPSPRRTAPLRSSGPAEAVRAHHRHPGARQGARDLDDLASLGEVDTGAPDGTPGRPAGHPGPAAPGRRDRGPETSSTSWPRTAPWIGSARTGSSSAGASTATSSSTPARSAGSTRSSSGTTGAYYIEDLGLVERHLVQQAADQAQAGGGRRRVLHLQREDQARAAVGCRGPTAVRVGPRVQCPAPARS